MLKKPMTPGTHSFYGLQVPPHYFSPWKRNYIVFTRNKMPNPNMLMQPNNLPPGMKPQDPNLAMQQLQGGGLKIENVSMQAGKKVAHQYMVKPGMISSPNLNPSGDQTKPMDMKSQIPQNPMMQQSSMGGMNALSNNINMAVWYKNSNKEFS